MNPLDLIREHHRQFSTICQQHEVDRLYVFGSSITDRFDPEKSDVDLLVFVDIKDPLERGETLMSLWDRMEQFFGCKVDLLTENSICNPYLKSSIERTKKLIYDGEGEKVLVWHTAFHFTYRSDLNFLLLSAKSSFCPHILSFSRSVALASTSLGH